MPNHNPFQVVKDFEREIAEYTGAPYVVSTNSCTSALLLACAWHFKGNDYYKFGREAEIPKRTYCSVPMAIIHAGGRPTFRDEDWKGAYQLKPLPVWDSARLFTSGMYESIADGSMVCVSFQASKTLGDTQGGAILHDDPIADAWLRRMRFDGRAEGVAPIDDNITMVGHHAYMSNDVAARLLLKLRSLPRDNDPLENDNYPDLSTMEVFR